MNNDKFIYKKVQYIEDGETRYNWFLIDKDARNGVQFHGTRAHDGKRKKVFPVDRNNKWGFITFGIEQHSTTPLYDGHKPIENCEVTGGDCYCDGTSLYASEQLGHVNPDDCDAEVWSVLEQMYEEWFGDE